MTWRDRIPKDYVPSGTIDGEEKQIVWTALEKQIMLVCQQTKLTEPQRDLLDKDVHVLEHANVLQTHPSPNDLYERDELFRAFADKKIQAMISNGASPGRLIKALANYVHPHGWLAYRDLYTPKPTERSGDLPPTTIVGDLFE